MPLVLTLVMLLAKTFKSKVKLIKYYFLRGGRNYSEGHQKAKAPVSIYKIAWRGNDIGIHALFQLLIFRVSHIMFNHFVLFNNFM